MQDKKIKVIHIISQFAAGGIEKWLIDFEQNTIENKIPLSHEFYCISGKAGPWADKLSSPYLIKPNLKSGYINFFIKLYRKAKCTPKENTIFHIHLYKFSAFIALIIWLSGHKQIVVHAHNDKRNIHRPFFRKLNFTLYSWITRHLFKYFPSHQVAASIEAAEDLFGKKNKAEIIYCGVSLKDLRSKESRDQYINEFSQCADTIRFVSIGSLSSQKNHDFLINAFHLATKIRDDITLIIIGEGPLRETLLQQIRNLDLTNKVFLLGRRDDALSILQNFASYFLFPSKFEGLGLALIEAQFSNIPCIISDAIPHEAEIHSQLITRLELDSAKWVKKLSAPSLKEQSFDHVSSAGNFEIGQSSINFYKFYTKVANEN